MPNNIEKLDALRKFYQEGINSPGDHKELPPPFDLAELRPLYVYSVYNYLRTTLTSEDYDFVLWMLHHNNSYIASLGQVLLRPFIVEFGRKDVLLPILLKLWNSTLHDTLKCSLLFDIFYYGETALPTDFPVIAIDYLEKRKCLFSEMMEECFEGKDNIFAAVSTRLAIYQTKPLKTAIWLFALVGIVYSRRIDVESIIAQYDRINTSYPVDNVIKLLKDRIRIRFKFDSQTEEMNKKWQDYIKELKYSLVKGAESVFGSSNAGELENPRVFINVRNRHLSYPRGVESSTEIPPLQWRYDGLSEDDFYGLNERSRVELSSTFMSFLNLELFGGLFLSSSFKIEDYIRIIRINKYVSSTDLYGNDYSDYYIPDAQLYAFVVEFTNVAIYEFGDVHPRTDEEENYLRQILNYKLIKYFPNVGKTDKDRWEIIIKLIERRYLFNRYEVDNALAIVLGVTYGAYYPMDIYVVLSPKDGQASSFINTINSAIDQYFINNPGRITTKAVSLWDLVFGDNESVIKSRMDIILLERTYSHIIFQLFAQIYSLYFKFFIAKGKNEVIIHGLSAMLAAPIKKAEDSVKPKETGLVKYESQDELLIPLNAESITNATEYLIIPYPVGPDPFELTSDDISYNTTYKEISRHKVVSILTKLQEYYNDILNEQKKLRMKDAVVAIMGRNVSHNIGSHVIAKVAEHYDDISSMDDTEFVNMYHNFDDMVKLKQHIKKAKDLFRYIQQRNDLIAQISTTPPSWTQDMQLGEVIDGFTEQVYLLEYIANFRNLKLSKENILLEKKLRSVEVAMPTGNIGCHAFYSILENIIRNAARHGMTETLNNLTISISVADYNVKYFRITINDNCGNADVTRDINAKLQSPMLDTNGKLLAEDWGIKETKICASYLRLIAPENIDEQTSNNHGTCEEPSIIIAKANGKDMSYEIYLLKSKKAIVISDLPYNVQEYRDYGIDFISPNDFVSYAKRNIVHKFLVIDVSKMSEPGLWLRENIFRIISMLPYHICILGNDPTIILHKNVCHYEGFVEFTDPVSFYENIWKSWTNQFWPNHEIAIRGDKPSSMLNYFGADFVSSNETIASTVRKVVFDHNYVDNDNELYDRASHFYSYSTGENLWTEQIKQIELKKYIYYELLEMGATNIAVIDSRISDCRFNMIHSKYYKTAESRQLINYWHKKGVDIFDVKDVINNFVFFVHNFVAGKYHFMVFHQGEIDEIKKRYHEQFAVLWEQLTSKVVCTVIDTGRGTPPQAKEQLLRWMPYSILQEYLIHKSNEYLAKMKLLRCLTSAKVEGAYSNA